MSILKIINCDDLSYANKNLIKCTVCNDKIFDFEMRIIGIQNGSVSKVICKDCLYRLKQEFEDIDI